MIPQFVRDADSFMLTTGKEDYYGRNFMRRLALLNGKTRDKYFKIINEVLLIAVPQLENLSFVKDEKGVPHIEAKYQHWRAKGSKQNEQMFSDGTIRLIGFCSQCLMVLVSFFWKSRKLICMQRSFLLYQNLWPRFSATKKTGDYNYAQL